MISSTIFRLASSYTRNSPVRKGKGRIMKLILDSPLSRFSCLTKSKDGRIFEFDSKSRLNLEIYFYGTREPEESNLMNKLVREGDIVFDVGANSGWYTTLFSLRVGCDGRVYAIEPVPSTCNALQRTVSLNQCSQNVQVLNNLCGEKEGPGIIFQFPELHPGLSSSRPIGETRRIEYRIDTITIDSLIAREKIESVGMLKIDVEGAELLVLKGALKSLGAGRIKAILIEINEERAAAFGYEFSECLDLIRGANDFLFMNTNPTNGSRKLARENINFKNGDNLLVVLNGSAQMERLAADTLI